MSVGAANLSRMDLHGRGAGYDPPNRFTGRWVEPDPEWGDPDDPAPETRFMEDESKSAIAWNDSPDLGFAAGINPYRGCEHGCSYCLARPYHEYLGMSAGVEFETRIMVKPRLPELLRTELSRPRWEPQPIVLSGVTDPYQPVERRLRITRGCLEVLRDFRNPVCVITKGALVARDADLLGELAGDRAACVNVSIPTLDPDLAAQMEPRAARPHRRLEAVAALARAGVPVGVSLAPVIPGLTDREMPAILTAAREAGATYAWFSFVRLPGAVEQLFVDWLERRLPARKEKVLARVRELRGGALNDGRFFARFRGQGAYAAQIEQMFHVHARRLGLDGDHPALSAAAFRRPRGPQRTLFVL